MVLYGPTSEEKVEKLVKIYGIEKSEIFVGLYYVGF